MLPGVGLTIVAGEVTGAGDPGATPVPLNAIVPLPPDDALLLYCRLPVTAPAAVGANARLTVITSCGATVIGSDPSPAIENGWPLIVTAEMSTDAVPLLVTVIEAVPVCPTVTLPNATDVDESTSEPVPAADTLGVVTIEPQPDSAIVRHTPATATRAPPQRASPPGLRERCTRPERLL